MRREGGRKAGREGEKLEEGKSVKQYVKNQGNVRQKWGLEK